MPVDHIRYDLLAQEALRGMVRKILKDVAKSGLPHEHHFFISFDTRHAGVKLSDRLLEEYPQEMTIVIQHQFWGLVVTDYAFEIGLSFSGIAERLVVPFAAIKGFYDPSVQFGLQFEPVHEETDSVPPRELDTASKEGRKPSKAGHKPSRQPAPAAASGEDAGKETPAGEAAKTEGGAEIVSLDRFRKK